MIICTLLFLINTTPVFAFFDFGGWEKKYNELSDKYEKLESKYTEILRLNGEQGKKITELNNVIYELDSKREHWKDQTYEYYDKLEKTNNQLYDKTSEYNKISDTVNNLESENYYLSSQTNQYSAQLEETRNELYQSNNKLLDVNDKLDHSRNKLLDVNDKLDHSRNKLLDVNDKLDTTTRAYNQLSDDYDYVYNEAYRDRIEISKTKLNWSFYDSKDNSYDITWDISYIEELKKHSDWKSLNSLPFNLRTHGGYSFSTIDLDGFVRGDFSRVIDELYVNSRSSSDFIWEVWSIVSKMTVYDKDVNPESEGRYALETLHRGGGDCEDLVILVADLIRSSSYTSSWNMEIKYMDTNSIDDPQTVDHVILYIHDGEYTYYIEATAEPSWDWYPNGVAGWSIAV